MRLSLNNWPPVASHLTCIFLGIGIANIMRPSQRHLPQGIRNRVVISFGREILPPQLRETIREGTRVLLARRQLPSGRPACLLRIQRVFVLQAEPFVALGVDTKDALHVLRLGKTLQSGTYVLVPNTERDRVALPLCQEQGRVSYGSARS